MAASQADERLLAQLRDRVGQRVTGWRPGARVRGVSPLTGGTSSLTFLVDLARRRRRGDPGGAQGGAARARPAPQPRRAAPGAAAEGGPGDPAAAGTGRAVLRPGRPAGGSAVHGDEPGPGGVRGAGAVRRRRAARARPGAGPVLRRRAGAGPVARDRPAAAGLGDEPAVGLADEVDRWTRAFVTLPRDMAGDYERAAKALRASIPGAAAAGGQPRRLPAREHPVRRRRGSTRSSTGRSGRSATRASTWPG